MTRRTPLLAAGLAAAVLLAACNSGGSIQNAGNATGTTATPATTAAGATTSPATSAGGAVATSVAGQTTVAGATTAPATVPVSGAASTEAPSTTAATPLDSLPTCNPKALDSATGPVNITFWHGLTAELEKAITALTDQYNSSQTKVHVTLQNQGGYEQALDKYLQSGQDARPQLLQSPEYAVQVLRDTDSFVPVEACAKADGYDTSVLLPSVVNAYSTGGVQWAMPFNVSNPVLFYNKKTFAKAGLDPNKPPRTLEELKADSQQIVSSGAAKYGLVVDTDFDGGGGWYIEQWFAKAKQFYADNDNGRSAPATKVLFDGQTGVDLYTYLQDLVKTGGGYNVGDNTSGQDAFLKLADPKEPGSMTIGTSAALGTVLTAIKGGIAPQIGVDDIGVGPMPGPGGSASVLVGGAALWIAADKGDQQIAATWDFIKFLISAQSQSTWAATTGYVPLRKDALALAPLSTTYQSDPRFQVAFDDLLQTPDEPTAVGPLLGPQREIRVLTARALATVFKGGDVAKALHDAATQADQLLAQYAQQHTG
jgi:sn-glycerol 3-phosphate transport system substrate-binding protein